MSRISPTAPRLNQIDAVALADAVFKQIRPWVTRWNTARSAETLCEAIRDGARWAQTGQGHRDGFEEAIVSLTTTPAGLVVPLPTDPDRLTQEPLDHLALVALAVAARRSIEAHEPITPPQLAALGCVSARWVRGFLDVQDGLIPYRLALSCLQGRKVPGL